MVRRDMGLCVLRWDFESFSHSLSFSELVYVAPFLVQVVWKWTDSVSPKALSRAPMSTDVSKSGATAGMMWDKQTSWTWIADMQI